MVLKKPSFPEYTDSNKKKKLFRKGVTRDFHPLQLVIMFYSETVLTNILNFLFKYNNISEITYSDKL